MLVCVAIYSCSHDSDTQELLRNYNDILNCKYTINYDVMSKVEDGLYTFLFLKCN